MTYKAVKRFTLKISKSMCLQQAARDRLFAFTNPIASIEDLRSKIVALIREICYLFNSRGVAFHFMMKKKLTSGLSSKFEVQTKRFLILRCSLRFP